jgi:hypothetical protein
MTELMIVWLMQYQEVFVWIGLISFLTFLFGLLLMPFVIMRLPEDYFLSPQNGDQTSTVLRDSSTLFLVFKNLMGGVLLCLGVVMLVLPGPGLMVALIGLSLVDIPGKRWVLGRILNISGLRSAINGLRGKRGRPPLKFED